MDRYTAMRRLTTGIHSEKFVAVQTYINLDNIANYTPSLYGTAYCS
jgi:hypothetical protein